MDRVDGVGGLLRNWSIVPDESQILFFYIYIGRNERNEKIKISIREEDEKDKRDERDERWMMIASRDISLIY